MNALESLQQYIKHIFIRLMKSFVIKQAHPIILSHLVTDTTVVKGLQRLYCE